MKINKLRLRDRNLYLVVQYELFKNEDDVLDAIAVELENGTSIVHLDFGHAFTDEILKVSNKVRGLCSLYDALLILNDRLDIAQIVSADGVYLSENSFSVEVAREFLGDNFIIGTNYSVQNADYIISDTKNINLETPCYVRVLGENVKNNKIFYKKI